jgi:hypothetical protein
LIECLISRGNCYFSKNQELFQDIKKSELANLGFDVGPGDFIFVLTKNRNYFGNGLTNLIIKIFFFKENYHINIFELANLLAVLNLRRLNILKIRDNDENKCIYNFLLNEPCKINYLDLNLDAFLKLLAFPSEGPSNFLKYNKHSVYILKNMNFSDLKRVLTNVEGCNVDIVKGLSQKTHILSSMECRLSLYITAILNCNYSKIASLNAFNVLSKTRYIPGINRRVK